MDEGDTIRGKIRFTLAFGRTPDGLDGAWNGWHIQIQCGYAKCDEVPIDGPNAAFIPVPSLDSEGISYAFTMAINEAMAHCAGHALSGISGMGMFPPEMLN